MGRKWHHGFFTSPTDRGREFRPSRPVGEKQIVIHFVSCATFSSGKRALRQCQKLGFSELGSLLAPSNEFCKPTVTFLCCLLQVGRPGRGCRQCSHMLQCAHHLLPNQRRPKLTKLVSLFQSPSEPNICCEFC